MIVVIEDLQWVDLPPARAVLFALRRLSADQVLAVLTCRPLGLGRLDPGWSRFLAGDGRVVRLQLGGLSAGELEMLCRELGRPGLPERTLRRLAEQSGGSPLFIRALPQRPLPQRQAALGCSLPAGSSIGNFPRARQG